MALQNDCPTSTRGVSTQVAIVGSGFGGLATAHSLKQAGIHDFLILERASDVGGVWRDNRYPGCACDVQSHLYSFSFAPNPDWSRAFSPQGEILSYLKRCTEALGLKPHVRLNHEVRQATWDEASATWSIQTNQGEVRAQHLVGAFGSLSDPLMPKLAGVEGFKGEVFHSAHWPQGFNPKGKRIAVVGTGASALQFIPAIQPDVAQMHVFQRTPPWVLPRHDGPISSTARSLFRKLPWLQKLARAQVYVHREALALGFLHPWLMARTQGKALKHMHAAVKDPVLRQKLTPDYTLGCKRILISNTYYPALAQTNVEVITDGVKQVMPEGVIGQDGAFRPVDTIIYGTGFQTKDLPFTHLIHDGKGRTLASAWQGSPKAYMGTTVHGFPNLYLLHGPNIGLGHTSVVYMLEAQARHIVGVIQLAQAKGCQAVEPTAQAQQRFLTRIEKMMRGTVWVAGGCESWYLDETGRNSSIWPGFTFSYAHAASKVAERDYAWRSPAASTPGAQSAKAST
jgi:cation diffusion facilitator CzcD-associated flavoprotein CzcO